MKQHSPSFERNKQPIFDILKTYLKDNDEILEVGSGTGQHAIYFASQLPHIHWQTSDLLDNHPGISEWIKDSNLSNVASPLHFDALKDIPKTINKKYPVVFTANTFHIMSWQACTDLLKKLPALLQDKGLFILYGPFNFNGEFTSSSNKSFDMQLKSQNPFMGIRDFEAIDTLASQNHLQLIAKHQMPANNFMLVWQKR